MLDKVTVMIWILFSSILTSSVCKKEGRYEVALPWKKECPDFTCNCGSAEALLSGLMRKLDRDTELRDQRGTSVGVASPRAA